jgi:hypothetical protein
MYERTASIYTPLLDFNVELVGLLFFIGEILGSNVGQETSYPDQEFSFFFLVPPDNCGDRASQ